MQIYKKLVEAIIRKYFWFMKIGIIREEKFPADKRVVFTPETCVKTVKRFPEIEFFIVKLFFNCMGKEKIFFSPNKFFYRNFFHAN